jgi:hypothetical protein
MCAERQALGSAEWVTAVSGAHPLRRGTQTTVLAAAEWSTLTSEQRSRVNAAALIKLADLYMVRGRKRYEGIRDFAAEYGALGHLTEYRVIAPVWRSLAETSDDDRIPHSLKRASRRAKVEQVGRFRHVMGEPLDRWNETIRDAWWLCANLYVLGVIDQDGMSDRVEDYLLMIPSMVEDLIEHVPHEELSGDIGPRGVAWLDRWVARWKDAATKPRPDQLARARRHAAKMDPYPESPLPKLTRPEKRATLTKELQRRLNECLGNGEIRPAVVGDTLPMRLDWEADTLRAALWLQAARLVEQAGTVRFRECAECRTPLVFTGDRKTGTRAGTEYCSQACTQRGYRKRQARARTLHRKGWSIADIAAELNVETRKGRTAHQIVDGWLKPRRRKAR